MGTGAAAAQEAARLAEQEAARERAMIDEVVKRIMIEDASEVATKRQRQQETKDFITMFLKQQDGLRQKEREAAAAEDRKIAGGQAREHRNCADSATVVTETTLLWVKNGYAVGPLSIS